MKISVTVEIELKQQTVTEDALEDLCNELEASVEDALRRSHPEKIKSVYAWAERASS